ncbi:M48 family metallopeptidase [Sphingomonas sp. Leaf21]|uniref:M48 family metallopeptidase n=1 Tax=Sphingomonas sp. Leaf21 TaxID=2876550 RepID=UPI001E553C4B|nr:M48 family metallopeptidase [Sphingomonas sp. Leaf21]
MSRVPFLSSAFVALSALLLTVPHRAPATAPLDAAATVERSDDAALFGAMRDADLRLATIAWRLATANAAICRDVAPTPGLVIHAIDQYDPGVRKQLPALFGFDGPVAVEAVVAGSAAAKAGVLANDTIAAIDGKPLSANPAGATQANTATRDAAQRLLLAEPADRPLRLTLVRKGARREVTVPAQPGCRSRFEMLMGPGLTASADGDIVQIGSRFFERFDDRMIAVVVGHEFSHNILHHRDRLDSAGVKRGILSEFGRNGRLFRQTETEADLLGVVLMRNAGYDPQDAVRFWREHGGEVDGGLFRSRTHPSSSARADAVAAEIATIPADAPTPYRPPLLDRATAPLR